MQRRGCLGVADKSGPLDARDRFRVSSKGIMARAAKKDHEEGSIGEGKS